MKATFTGRSKMTIEYKDKEIVGITTDIGLELSNNLDFSEYLDKGIPTQAGNKVLTQSLIQGLIANVYMGNKMKYVSTATHLEFIIEEFQKVLDEVKE
jgi:hypothetical protein